MKPELCVYVDHTHSINTYFFVRMQSFKSTMATPSLQLENGKYQQHHGPNGQIPIFKLNIWSWANCVCCGLTHLG